jgi:hypothetical protein
LPKPFSDSAYISLQNEFPGDGEFPEKEGEWDAFSQDDPRIPQNQFKREL